MAELELVLRPSKSQSTLPLKFPESGGQSLDISVPVMEQRKMDSGRSHWDEPKVTHTGVLFLPGKNKTSEFSKLNLS